MANKCRTGATVVEIEFSNYVKDRIDEVVATGFFGDINDFMQHAALAAISDYERSKKECLLKELNELRTSQLPANKRI
jgi:hypothetical protein